MATLIRTPSLTRDLPSERRNGGGGDSSSSSSMVAALARSLSRPSLLSREDGFAAATSGGDLSSERHEWPSQLSQTLPRSYKLTGGAGSGSGGGPQLAAAWRDAVAKATTVLSRSSSRSSLKTEAATPAAAAAVVRSASSRFALHDEQQDFAHTLPKSYTQLRSAMADNQMLAPRAANSGQEEREEEEDKRPAAGLPSVQTVLTVQVCRVRLRAWALFDETRFF